MLRRDGFQSHSIIHPSFHGERHVQLKPFYCLSLLPEHKMGVFGKGLAFLLRDFSCWTSTHGIPHIGMANSQLLRIFWILVVFVCFCLFIWQLNVLVTNYLAYVVNTETKLQFSERVFPTVTICNLNPWKKAVNPADEPSLEDITSLINAYGNSQSGYSTNDLYGFRDGLDGERQQRAVRWTTLMSEKVLTSDKGPLHAYDYDDLVISCTYNAKTCNGSDFETFKDPTYGHCQTFNFDARYSSSRAGPLYGLRMVMKTDQDKYLPWTEASGVVVAIHGQEEHPFPDVFGYFAPPGTASSMGVRYVSTKRKPAPYGDCTEQKEMESQTYNGTYEVEACFRGCLQKNIIDKCGCYDPAYTTGGMGVESCYSLPNDMTTAGMTKNAINCIEQFTNPDGSTDSFNLIRDCSCPQPCVVETYSVTVSTAQWPSNAYTPSECNASPNLTDPQPWGDPKECIKWYQDNTLLIEIYYERMNYQVLTESPAYSIVNLVSDIGGQVGLFLGMSIISVIELFTLILLLICYCATHKQRQQEIQNIEMEMEQHKKQNDELAARRRRRQQQKQGEENPVYEHDKDDQIVPPPVQETNQ